MPITDATPPSLLAQAGQALLLLAWAAPLAAQTPAPISAITLSSGGVAEIRREAEVAGDARVRIEVPLAQVDDVLKSLTVRDPAGTVAGLALDGPAPVSETFARLPFSPEDLGSPARLAAALQGVPARATSGGRSVQGRILGVSEAGSGEPNQPPQAVLSVMSDDGAVRTLKLGSDTELELLDEGVRAMLSEAAQVSGRGRAEGVRAIDLSVAGSGTRRIGIDYVTAAPVWKTAYRLSAGAQGPARLQAWAVIENATAENWRGVELTLAAGAPVLLSQRLHERYWATRPDIPVAVGAAAAPDADRAQATPARELAGAALAVGRAARPPAAPADMAPSAEPPTPMAGAAAAADAREGDTDARYRLPAPVDLQAGRTLSLPFLDVELPAERVSLYQPGRGIHPVAAIYLENTSAASLPAGLLTIYDPQSGHVGDARLAGIPAGESRMVGFAQDRKVAVTVDTRPQEHITEVALADGVLRADRVVRRVAVYSVKGAADAPRTVIVEHPRQAGWTFSSDALDSQTPTHYRLRLALAAGAEGKIEAVSQRTESTRIALLDAEADTLLQWSGIAADGRTAERLKALAQRRAALSQAQSRAAGLDERHREAADNQARIRENLKAVPADSELGQRYGRMLAQEEDRIAALQEDQRAARDEVERLRRELAAALQD